MDRARHALFVRGSGLEDLGARAEDLLGLDPERLFRLTPAHPFLAAFDQALHGDTTDLRTEWAGVRYLTRLAPMRGAAGGIEGAAGISLPLPTEFDDRTLALDESAERLRRLVEESPFGIVHSHRDGRILDANDAFLDLIGFTREDLRAGRLRWDRISLPEYAPLDQRAIEECLADGRSQPYEKEYVRSNGTRVPVMITVSRLPGRLHEGVASILDLTPQKRAEQRLRSQLVAAEILSRARSLEEAAPDLLRAVAETLQWDTAALRIGDDRGLRCDASWPSTPDRALDGLLVRAQPTFPRDTASWIDDAAPAGGNDATAQPEETRCCAAVPVRSASGLRGHLVLGSRAPRTRDDELLASLLAIARQLALFLDRVHADEERRTAESESRRLQARLHLHVDRMPLAHIVGDESSRIVAWNPAAERLFGWRAEEMTGRDAFERIVPHELRDELRALARRPGREAGSVIIRRCPGRTRAGRPIVCDWVNTPLFAEDGSHAGFVAMAQDVTEQVRTEEELRASEERYRSIVETTREGIWIGAADGRTTFANPRLAAMLGTTVPDLLGRSFLEFVPEADRALRRQDFAALLRDGPVLEEIALRRADGSPLWARISASPHSGVGALAAGALVMVTDVTEQRVLQFQLLHAQKMEALGRLAGGVAHDFNNVLTVIAGYGDLLGDRMVGDPEAREIIGEIRKATETAAALTKQLLTFSRRAVVEVQAFDWNERIVSNEGMLRRLLGEDIELTVELAPDLWSVQVDAGRMDQVLINLVVNARDAMPRGGRLELRTDNVEIGPESAHAQAGLDGGDYVLLTVSDNGLGMTSELLEHVFEPFFTTKAPGQGTGLGLATVYGIVKQFGGHVSVRSEAGIGTSFGVYLPRGEAAARGRQPSEEGQPTRGSETILLVEDEAAVRSFERLALETAGYRVLTAGSGDEALDLFVRHRAEVRALVTDVVMPLMSGRELADAIHQLAPRLPVLYLSGYTDDAILRHGVLAAEASFLQKPFSSAALCARLRAVLDEGRPGSLRRKRHSRGGGGGALGR